MRALVLGVATLALSAGAASAQAVYPSGYGYDDYATPVADLAAPAYGYAAPAYGYAAPAAPTVVIVTPAPAYAAAPVVMDTTTHPDIGTEAIGAAGVPGMGGAEETPMSETRMFLRPQSRAAFFCAS